jgi:hypothetical protein
MKLPSRRRRFLITERGAGVSVVTSVRVSVPAFGTFFHRGGAPQIFVFSTDGAPGNLFRRLDAGGASLSAQLRWPR